MAAIVHSFTSIKRRKCKTKEEGILFSGDLKQLYDKRIKSDYCVVYLSNFEQVRTRP